MLYNPRGTPSGVSVCERERQYEWFRSPQCSRGGSMLLLRSAVAGLQTGRSFSPLSVPIPHRSRVRRLARRSRYPRVKMAGWYAKNKPPFSAEQKRTAPAPLPPSLPPDLKHPFYLSGRHLPGGERGEEEPRMGCPARTAALPKIQVQNISLCIISSRWHTVHQPHDLLSIRTPVPSSSCVMLLRLSFVYWQSKVWDILKGLQAISVFKTPPPFIW